MADGSTYTDQVTGDLVLQQEETKPDIPKLVGHFENLAEEAIPIDVLQRLASNISELVAWDEQNQQPARELAAEHVKLLGIGKESEPDDTEYEKSDRSDHPLLLTAVTRFQSKALSAMLPSPDRVCRTEPAFDLTEIKDEDERDRMREECDNAGARVEKFMADYLLKRHASYSEDMDMTLFDCGLHGLGVKKVYNDMSRKSQKTRVEKVDLDDLIISYDTKNMRSGRIAHRVRMTTPDLIRNIQSGVYRVVRALPAGGDTGDSGPVTEAMNRMHGLHSAFRTGETHKLYEISIDLFLDMDAHPDGLARPYIVTIHAASQEILSVVRNWAPNDEDESPIERFVGYIYSPGKSAVTGIGLGALLANITKALRTAQRRGFEAGYLQNHPSGFKTSSLRIRDEGGKVRPGEFVDVDAPTGDIRQALMLHPFEGPSPGLITLAQALEQNGKELGGIASIDFAQLMKAGVAAGPAMAAYDESTEFQTAVHRRLYTAQSTELRLIQSRMREVYGNKPVPYGKGSTLHSNDLIMVDCIPVMKPGQVSRQRTILEATALLEAANAAPDILSKRKIMEEYVRALGKTNISEYMQPNPDDEPPMPADPVTEYAMVLQGAPITAGMEQNHQAHIDAHAAQMRMLQVSALPVEQGEMAMASLAAHIAQHMGMQMMVEVQAVAGIPMEAMAPGVPPEIAGQVAEAIASAVMELEASRRPEGGESKLEVAKVVGESRIAATKVAADGRMALADLQHKHQREIEDLKAKHAKDLQKVKDDAAMDRAVQDDDAALNLAAVDAKKQVSGTIAS